jgi:hypothetical protein
MFSLSGLVITHKDGSEMVKIESNFEKEGVFSVKLEENEKIVAAKV